jgi:hypothetical protein
MKPYSQARQSLLLPGILAGLLAFTFLVAVRPGSAQQDAPARGQASLDRELLVVGDPAPTRVRGSGYTECAGQEVLVGWFFRVTRSLTDGLPPAQRLIGAVPVRLDADGSFEAELAPLDEFPGEWSGYAAFVGDCVAFPTPQFGPTRLLAPVRVGVPIASPEVAGLGLALPAPVAARSPAVFILPRELNWLQVFPGEPYASNADKAHALLAPRANGTDCSVDDGSYVAPNGAVVFVLGVDGQAGDCAREGARVTFGLRQGSTAAPTAFDAPLRRGLIQPIVLVVPPPGSPGGSATPSAETPVAPNLGSTGPEVEATNLPPGAQSGSADGSDRRWMPLVAVLAVAALGSGVLVLRRRR